MGIKHIASGWRGFSITKETPYGTAETINTLLYFKGQPADVKAGNQITNEDEITGFSEPTTRDILTKMLEFSHEQRSMPHNLALFLALCGGKVTTDQQNVTTNPNAYRHYIERDLTAVDLPSVTMIENDGVQQKKYPGIICKSLEVRGEREGFVEVTAECKGNGAESNDASAKPSAEAESYLRYGDVTLTRGGAITGTVALGTLAVGSSPTDLSAKLRSFNYRIDNLAQPIYEIGDQTKQVSRMERGRRWEHTLNCQLEIEDTSHHDAMLAGTQYVLHIPIVGGVIGGGDGSLNYRCELYFPLVEYMESPKSYDDRGILIVDAVFKVLEDATFGSVIAEIHNKVPAYLG